MSPMASVKLRLFRAQCLKIPDGFADLGGSRHATVWAFSSSESTSQNTPPCRSSSGLTASGCLENKTLEHCTSASEAPLRGKKHTAMPSKTATIASFPSEAHETGLESKGLRFGGQHGHVENPHGSGLGTRAPGPWGQLGMQRMPGEGPCRTVQQREKTETRASTLLETSAT